MDREAHKLFQGDTWDTRTIVVLHTDNGLEGLGEILGSVNETVERDLGQLHGTNPCRWLAHPQLNIWVAPAIYDLVGKANEVPAYQLFGPKVRSWVPVSTWTVSQTPAKMAEEVEHAVEQGYTWSSTTLTTSITSSTKPGPCRRWRRGDSRSTTM